MSKCLQQIAPTLVAAYLSPDLKFCGSWSYVKTLLMLDTTQVSGLKVFP